MWELVSFLLVAITLPGLVELILLLIGEQRYSPPSTVQALDDSLKGRLCVVIPAYNEEKQIASLLDHLNTQATPCDVLVIADNCTDQTAAIVRSRAVRVIERQDPTRRGKPFALQLAFDQLLKEGYDWIAVLDADAIPDPYFLTELNKNLQFQPAAIQVANTFALPLNPSWPARWNALLFGTYNQIRARGRAGWNLSCGLLGNGWVLHRRTLEEIPYSVDSIAEDLEYHIRLVKAQKRVAFVPSAKAQTHPPSSQKGRTTQQARWAGGRWQVVKEEVPQLIGLVMKGHLQLIEPLLDLLTLPLTYQVICLFLLLLIAPEPGFQFYALTGTLSIFLYLWRGTTLLNRPKSDLLALFICAPSYLIHKIKLLPHILHVAKNRTWNRTERD